MAQHTEIVAAVEVYNCIRALAARCDGAHKRDDVGFNGRDAEFGRSIADRPYERWTPKMHAAAWKMLRTYRNTQLAAWHINYDDLLPRMPNPNFRYVAGHHSTDAKGHVYAVWYGPTDVVTTGRDFAELASHAIDWNASAKWTQDDLFREQAESQADERRAEAANERALAGGDYYDEEASLDAARCELVYQTMDHNAWMQLSAR